MHPVKNKPITTPYKKPGKAWSLGYHTGVDYAAAEWYDIVAPASGYIARAGWDRSYGNYVILRSTIQGVPYNIYLCHMVKILVKPGQQVRIGQHIGEVGNTGNSYGSHCHLETRKPPYSFSFRDGSIVDPRVAYMHTEGVVTPVPNKPTVLDLCVWNLPPSKWYTPWRNRAGEIARELRDEASLYLFQELYYKEQIDTIKAALPGSTQHSAPMGLEIFYTDDKYDTLDYEFLRGPVQNRGAQFLSVKRLDTGKVINLMNVHGPIRSDSDKERFGDWLLDQVVEHNIDIVAGDFNISSRDKAPKRQLRDIGFRDFKEQASITNEDAKEYIPEGWDLCTIMTKPSGPVDIIGGEVDITTNRFESDHRRLEARIVIAP